jgi:hypothetical protein
MAVPTGLYRDPQGNYWVIDAETGLWRGATSDEAAQYVAPAATIDPETGLFNNNNSQGAGFSANTASPQGIPGAAGATASTPAPTSYDPPAGGPTYTPGIVFGQGQLPGKNPAGGEYQRNWFDVGPSGDSEALNQTYYNDPNNWGFAWDKVVNQFGGMQGGDFNKWLSAFGSKARNDYQNTVPYAGGSLNVADFLDQYAPQVKGVYDLMPGSSKGRGGAMPLAGRTNY